MGYPANVATVTVTGTWVPSDGSTVVPSGTVTFTPNVRLVDGSTGQLIDQVPLIVPLVNGAITATVMATDDPDLSPAGWAYVVTEQIAGQLPVTYLLQFPAAVPSVNLATLAPLVAAPGLVGYVALSAVGAPSGVASLDGTGQVPASQLGHAGGGGGGTPASTVTDETSYGVAKAVGVGTGYAREDHTHGSPALASSAATASAVGDSAAIGTGTTPSRADHRHGREAFGSATAQTGYGAATADGVAATVSRSDHAHGTPSLASTSPSTSAVGDAAAAGSGTTAAKADHTHGREAFAAPAASAVGDTQSAGSATTVARSDHRHAREAFAVAGSSAVGDSAAAGAATTVARSDHTHGREAFGAVTAQTGYGAASANGSAATVARSDHQHGTPEVPGILPPAAMGLLAWTLPYQICKDTDTITSGNFVACLIRATGSFTITNLGCWVSLAGVTSSGTNAMGLYTEAGVLIDNTGDMSAAFATLGFQEAALGTPRALTAGTNYWIGLNTHFSGTAMKLAALNAWGNFVVVKSTRVSVFTTAQANLPGSFTPSSLTANSGTYFMSAS